MIMFFCGHDFVYIFVRSLVRLEACYADDGINQLRWTNLQRVYGFLTDSTCSCGCGNWDVLILGKDATLSGHNQAWDDVSVLAAGHLHHCTAIGNNLLYIPVGDVAGAVLRLKRQSRVNNYISVTPGDIIIALTCWSDTRLQCYKRVSTNKGKAHKWLHVKLRTNIFDTLWVIL